MGEVTDHLDASPSETVRRHAATFRSVRLRLAARESAARESRDELEARGEFVGGEGLGGGADGEEPERGYVDGTARDVGGDGLRVLGARSAASVVEEATAGGWRVVGRFASHRRESDGRPVDVAVVMAMRVGPDGRVDRWAMGQWRTDPIALPMKRKWKFTGGTAKDAQTGIRPVGARELNAIVTGKISSPNNDALECEQTGIEGGEGSHGEGRG